MSVFDRFVYPISMMDNDPKYDDLHDDLDLPQPYWTRRRIALAIFALIVVAALLAYTLPGLFLPPPPPPTLAPGSFI